MNERIKDLFEQACFETEYDDIQNLKEMSQRFAELIVRECLNNMENCDGDLDFAIWKTKQYFGVDDDQA